MSQHNLKPPEPKSQIKTPAPRADGVTFAIRPDYDIPEDPPEEGTPIGEASMPPVPYNREAEEAVIGSVLINPEAFPALAERLKQSDFYLHRHGWIWAAFGKLAARGEPIDYRTVCDQLARMGQLEETGGPAYLTVLINQVPNSLNAEAYERAVKECAIRRGLTAAANQIVTLTHDPKTSIEDVIAGSLDAVQSQTQETEQRRYIVRNAAFALQPQPAIDYLVDRLITTASVNVFYGEPGSKKTYSALSLAVCAAAGKPWLDMETKQCPVLLIDEESGERRFSRRLNAAIHGALCGNEDLPLSFVSLAGFKLDEDADPVLLEALVKSTGARLLIIDALADVMSGDENDKADVQPVFNHLRKIAERTDCAIVLIHHAGKAGGYRGSSAIKGAVDLMVQVQSENGSNLVNFKSEKNRDGESATWAAEATWTADQFYLQPVARSLVEHFSDAEQYVIDFLTEHGPAHVSEIKNSADQCSPEAARTAVYRLARKSKITRTNPGESGEACYALA